MGMCLPCLGGAAGDVVVTPDPVSTLLFIYTFVCCLCYKTPFTAFSEQLKILLCLFSASMPCFTVYSGHPLTPVCFKVPLKSKLVFLRSTSVIDTDMVVLCIYI